MAPSSTIAFLISTKLPICASSAISAPGRSRANGPIRAPRLTWQPSRWQNAWMVAPDSTVTSGPKTTFGPITTSRPITVSSANQTVAGSVSVAPFSSAAARARGLERRLGSREVGARVDPERFRLRTGDDGRGVSPRARASFTTSVR